MDLKKYPAFTATVGVLGLVCIAGVAFLGYQGLYDYPKKKSALDKDDKALGTMINSPVAPSGANVESAKLNLEQMGAVEKTLFEALKGKPPRFSESDIAEEPAELKIVFEDLTKKFPQYLQYTGSASELSGDFRESSGKLEKAVIAKKVRIYKKGDFGFGFKRYIGTGTSPSSNLQELAIQNGTINYLVAVLLGSKDANDELILQEVKREPIELQQQQPGQVRLKLEEDEYTPAANETIRREDIAKTLYFRLKFTARTPILRKFINRIRASEMPLFVRGVEVAKANEAVFQNPDAIPGSELLLQEAHPGEAPLPADAMHLPAQLGDATQHGAETLTGLGSSSVPTGPQVIVKDMPSEFTVSFEYILPTPPPAPATTDADATAANR